MALVDQISTPQIPKVIDPARHAVLDYGVAATFFALGLNTAIRTAPHQLSRFSTAQWSSACRC